MSVYTQAMEAMNANGYGGVPVQVATVIIEAMKADPAPLLEEIGARREVGHVGGRVERWVTDWKPVDYED